MKWWGAAGAWGAALLLLRRDNGTAALLHAAMAALWVVWAAGAMAAASLAAGGGRRVRWGAAMGAALLAAMAPLVLPPLALLAGALVPLLTLACVAGAARLGAALRWLLQVPAAVWCNLVLLVWRGGLLREWRATWCWAVLPYTPGEGAVATQVVPRAYAPGLDRPLSSRTPPSSFIEEPFPLSVDDLVVAPSFRCEDVASLSEATLEMLLRRDPGMVVLAQAKGVLVLCRHSGVCMLQWYVVPPASQLADALAELQPGQPVPATSGLRSPR